MLYFTREITADFWQIYTKGLEIMKKHVMELILKKIKKNAERGAGMASEYGTYETPVPKKLKRQHANRNWLNPCPLPVANGSGQKSMMSQTAEIETRVFAVIIPHIYYFLAAAITAEWRLPMKKFRIIAAITMVLLISIASVNAYAVTESPHYTTTAGTAGSFHTENTYSVTSSTLSTVCAGDIGVYFYTTSVGLQSSFIRSNSRKLPFLFRIMMRLEWKRAKTIPSLTDHLIWKGCIPEEDRGIYLYGPL